MLSDHSETKAPFISTVVNIDIVSKNLLDPLPVRISSMVSFGLRGIRKIIKTEKILRLNFFFF